MKHTIQLASAAAVLGLMLGGPVMAADEPGSQAQSSMSGSEAGTKGAPMHVSPDTVRQVQQALKDAGHDAGPVDAQWGDQTSQALRDYQRANDLAPTGNINQQSLSKLGIDASDFAASEIKEGGSSGAADSGKPSGTSGSTSGGSMGTGGTR